MEAKNSQEESVVSDCSCLVLSERRQKKQQAKLQVCKGYPISLERNNQGGNLNEIIEQKEKAIPIPASWDAGRVRRKQKKRKQRRPGKIVYKCDDAWKRMRWKIQRD
jgi:hypothetical protein